MRTFTALALGAFAALAVSASAAEALAFKDVPLGMSLLEFTRKFERAVRDDHRKPPFVDFGTVFASQTKPGADARNLRQHGMVSAVKTAPHENWGKTLETNDTIANVPAEVLYWFFAGSVEDWDRAAMPYLQTALGSRIVKYWVDWTPEERESADRIRLGLIRVRFDAQEFGAVASALQEKFGDPDRRQDAAKGTVLTWTMPGGDVITATEHMDSEISVVEYTRTALVRTAQAIFDSNAKARAADL